MKNKSPILVDGQRSQVSALAVASALVAQEMCRFSYSVFYNMLHNHRIRSNMRFMLFMYLNVFDMASFIYAIYLHQSYLVMDSYGI